MFFTGYFGFQDTVIAITLVAMFVSTVRKQPADSTVWIPFTVLSVLRWLAGGAVILLSFFTPLRHDSAPYYAMSAIGMILTLSGAFFFFGAKAPASQIISTGGEEGPELTPSGLYRLCRHPLYFGTILITAGIVTDFSSLAGAVLVAVVFVPLIVVSVRGIDAYWASRTGDSYAQYAKRVNMLIPSMKKSWK